MTETAVQYENAVQVTGQALRQSLESPLGEGVETRGGLNVTTSGSGLVVTVSTGTGWVRGDTITDQGLYRVRNDAAKSSDTFETGGFGAAHATLPRVDQVIARVYDHDADGSGLHKWRLEVLPGTPTAGATLDNRSGAAALPNSAMLLADVFIDAAQTALASTDIRNRRPFATRTPPPLLSDINSVGIEPLAPLTAINNSQIDITMNNMQAAIAVVIPRKIEGATKVRWKYAQGATALTGNYVFAFFDASGRKLIDTGTVALAGAANSFTNLALTITATTFEAGMYWLMVGLASLAGAGAFITAHGVDLAVKTTNLCVPSANYAVRSATGGITVPQTLLGFASVVGQTAETVIPPVPVGALSIG